MTDKPPRRFGLFAAQPENCGPIATSFMAGKDHRIATPILPTIAEGTAIAQPIRLPEVIADINKRLANGEMPQNA